MEQIATSGLDIFEHVVVVHGLHADGSVGTTVSTRLREDGVMPSSAAKRCMSSICFVAMVSHAVSDPIVAEHTMLVQRFAETHHLTSRA